jgi:hypothetical protein
MLSAVTPDKMDVTAKCTAVLAGNGWRVRRSLNLIVISLNPLRSVAFI